MIDDAVAELSHLPMHKWLMGVAVLVVSSGCSVHAQAVRVQLFGDLTTRCIDRALALSRQTGLMEQVVDKETGFMRVVSYSKTDRRGRPAGHVRHFGVTCLNPSTVQIAPLSASGGLNKAKISRNERNAMLDYAATLGRIMGDDEISYAPPPSQQQPVAAPPPPPQE